MKSSWKRETEVVHTEHGQMYPCRCPQYNLETLIRLPKSFLGLYWPEYKSWVSSLEESFVIIPESHPGNGIRKKYSQNHNKLLRLLQLPRAFLACCWVAAGGRKIHWAYLSCSGYQQTTLPSSLLWLWFFKVDEKMLGMSWENREWQGSFFGVQENPKNFCIAGCTCWSTLSTYLLHY